MEQHVWFPCQTWVWVKTLASWKAWPAVQAIYGIYSILFLNFWFIWNIPELYQNNYIKYSIIHWWFHDIYSRIIFDIFHNHDIYSIIHLWFHDIYSILIYSIIISSFPSLKKHCASHGASDCNGMMDRAKDIKKPPTRDLCQPSRWMGQRNPAAVDKHPMIL